MSNQPPHPDEPQQPTPPGFGPPPPVYPGQPGYPPQPPKKGKKKLIFGILGGILILCCGGGVIAALNGGNGGTPDASGTTTSAAKADATKAAGKSGATAPAQRLPTEPAANHNSEPGIGDAVRDGKFEFTVTKLDCSRTRVGSQYINKEAQGKFCLVSITVKNIGRESQTLDDSAQKAFDASGTEFSNDGEAEIYANSGSAAFLKEINPGNQVKGNVIFDVPKPTKLNTIELHDSMFSDGVKVALS